MKPCALTLQMHGGLVEVEFKDGSTVQGRLVVGADGSNSRTRELLCPKTWELEQLPVKLIGVTVRLTEEQVMPLRAINPLLFQGCCSLTGTYMWFSIVSTPAVNNSCGSLAPYYEGQIMLSWKVAGDDISGERELPKVNEERLAKMKSLAQTFDPRLRTIIESIPSDTKVTEIKIQDWPSVSWPSGKVTLIGDAAHTMTMYRGEGVNHGITDAQQLQSSLLSIHKGEVGKEEGIMGFETQMRNRAKDAVLLSREACLDAHDLGALKDDSPLVSKRAVVRTKATAAK
jgi:2-polyprenyl-6-methoxyphenol hydroxylase-like FAD-dependent oxidoreductase